MILGRSLTLRGFLLTLVAGGVVYVAAIAVVIGFKIGPTAMRLRAHTAALLDERDAIDRRIAELRESISDAHMLLRRARAGTAPPTTTEIGRLTTRLQARLDSLGARSTWRTVITLPPSMQVALARALEAEAEASAELVATMVNLSTGDPDGANGHLQTADQRREAAEAALEEAQRVAILDVVARESDLLAAARVTTRAVLWWAAVGTLLLVAAAVMMRQRLYTPLTNLEGALTRVAAGALETTVPVRRDDEMGRLGGLFNRMTGVLRDRAEEERVRRESLTERFGRILDESSSEIFLFDMTTLRCLQANRGARLNLGLTAAEVLELTPATLWPTIDPDAIADALAGLRDGSLPRVVLVGEQRRKDGSLYRVEIALYSSAAAQPPVIVAISEDATAWGRLEELNQELARLAVAGGRTIGHAEPLEALTGLTEAAARALRVERASVWLYDGAGLDCVDLFERPGARHSRGARLAAADSPEYLAALADVRTIAAHDARVDPRTRELRSYLDQTGVTALLDAPIRVGRRLAGVVRHETIADARRWTPDEQAFAASIADYAAIVLEAGERRRAEQALRQSEERYRATFEQAGVAMAEVSREGRLVRVNPRFEELLGRSADELSRLTWMDLTHPDDLHEDQAAFARLLSGQMAAYRREKRYLKPDGAVVWATISTAPVRDHDGAVNRLVTVAEDTTARRSLEAQLAHAQRMDSIGHLAGGVAHDFNNLLTAIMGHLELSKAAIAKNHPAYDDLTEVELAAQRAADLTRQLLTFARRQVVEPKVLDLNALTRGAEKLLRRLIGVDIELTTMLDKELGAVRADPGQVEQVIVNLAVNARDAMPQGGKLIIETSNVMLDEDYVGRYPGLKAGRYVLVAVSDTGTGMSEDVQARIFEPFFTTKGAGRGTGLGLATCYGIVKQAGGHIWVYSEIGRGSTFKVYLPRVDAAADALAAPAPAAQPTTGTETVLVVEDEEKLRGLIARTLSDRGYRVLAAANGDEAFAAARGHAGTIHLVVSDIVLPRLSGTEVVARLVGDRPDLKVVYMSGYTQSSAVLEELIGSRAAFLPKPFTPSALARRVREVLDA